MHCIIFLINKFYAIFSGAAKMSDVNENIVEDVIRKWLQGAPDRAGGRRMRDKTGSKVLSWKMNSSL